MEPVSVCMGDSQTVFRSLLQSGVPCSHHWDSKIRNAVTGGYSTTTNFRDSSLRTTGGLGGVGLRSKSQKNLTIGSDFHGKCIDYDE